MNTLLEATHTSNTHTHQYIFSWSTIWSIMYNLSILLSCLVLLTPGVRPPPSIATTY